MNTERSELTVPEYGRDCSIGRAKSIARRVAFTAALTLPFLILCSCAKTEAESANSGPHATVLLRNGGRYNGSIVASSPAQLTLVGEDNVRRSVEMADVKSIEYNDARGIQSRQPETARPAVVQSSPVHDNHYHPPSSSVNTRSNELLAGTRISVRTEEVIDSGIAVEAQGFASEVTQDVLDRDGAVVIPRGSNAQIIIRSAAKGGRFAGTSDMVLDLRSVSIAGRQYEVETADLLQRGKDGLGANKRTAKYAGGGAAIGAIIGAIAGQGKGAAIGAGSGAAAGVAGELLTKGASIRLPAETVLTFQLDGPLRVSSTQAIRSRYSR